MSLLEFRKQPNGNVRIQLVRGKGNKQELRELVDDDTRGINRKLLEALEYEFCNSSWETVEPEEVGALYSGLIFTDDCDRNDRTNDIERIGRIYYNPNYAVQDELAVILENGYVEYEGME